MNHSKPLFHLMLVIGGALFSGVLLVSCATKNQLKRMLSQNPDMVFDVIEKNPEKFVEVSAKANGEARRIIAEKNLNEEFKNPKVPFIGSDRAIRGNPLAAITIIEYSDFQCPYCQAAFSTINEIRKKYGDQVRFVLKHHPLSMHAFAMPAAERYEAIALQSSDKAYQFHDEVFNNQNQLLLKKESFLDEAARKVNVDLKRMKADIKSEIVKNRIDEDMAEAKKFEITGTPGFLVNGVEVRGAQPASEFEHIIDRWLKQGTAEPTGSNVGNPKK